MCGVCKNSCHAATPFETHTGNWPYAKNLSGVWGMSPKKQQPLGLYPRNNERSFYCPLFVGKISSAEVDW